MFGNGWLWLVDKNTSLQVVPTFGAGSPLMLEGVTPLLGIDLWEHAYYLDYRNSKRVLLDIED